jgi:hypothetical protein
VKQNALRSAHLPASNEALTHSSFETLASRAPQDEVLLAQALAFFGKYSSRYFVDRHFLGNAAQRAAA